MVAIKEIEEIKQEYNLEDYDIWCIKYQLSDVYYGDYDDIPDTIIKKIVNNKELFIF